MKKIGRLLRPLDLVKTPSGTIAVITETDGTEAFVEFLPNQEITANDYNAWWPKEDLTVLGNLVVLITSALAHPSGVNTEQGEEFFG